MTDDDPTGRAGRNEAIFRELNERRRDRSYQPSDGEAVGEFICECSDATCAGHIHVPLSVYEVVRADPRSFLLRPGHEDDAEHIVQRCDGYMIVKKQGESGRIAARTDPRA